MLLIGWHSLWLPGQAAEAAALAGSRVPRGSQGVVLRAENRSVEQ